MSRSVRSDAEYVLTDDERDQLVGWSRESSRLAVRARIVLRCAESGVVYEQVAADLGVSRVTVHAWRRRFTEAGLDGLADGERSGRPKADLVLTDEEREQLVRWSRRAKASPPAGLLGGGRPGSLGSRGGDTEVAWGPRSVAA